MSCITITFGDVAENHVGMQKLGAMSEEGGFTLAELKNVQAQFSNTELIKLHHYYESEDDTECEKAYILIIRNGVDEILKDENKTKKDFFKEQTDLTWDTTAKMRGRVVNKHARYNLCFAKTAQEADIENGKGTVVAFKDVPCLNIVRKKLAEILEKCKGLVAEGNLYYDTKKCGIGFHGDSERSLVVAMRLGKSMPLHYQWYYKTERVGRRCELVLNDGDIYFMSSKAVGQDWKKRNVPTLRHAAGCEKYLK